MVMAPAKTIGNGAVVKCFMDAQILIYSIHATSRMVFRKRKCTSPEATSGITFAIIESVLFQLGFRITD